MVKICLQQIDVAILVTFHSHIMLAVYAAITNMTKNHQVPANTFKEADLK